MTWTHAASLFLMALLLTVSAAYGQEPPAATQPSVPSGPPQRLTPSEDGQPPVPRTNTPPTEKRREFRSGGGLTIDDLPAPKADSLGVLVEGKGGLGRAMWRGTPRDLVTRLLPELPARPRSRVMRQLQRRLLLSVATVPPGLAVGEGLLVLRLDRLLAMGDIAGAQALFHVVASRRKAASLTASEIELAWLTNDTRRACIAVNQRVREREDDALLKALIFCQSLAGEHDKAALSLSLLRETKDGADKRFLALARLSGPNKRAARRTKINSLKAPTSLELAMMAAAGRKLPADVLSTDRPSLLRILARAKNAPADVGLGAAERAFALAVVPRRVLIRHYDAIKFKPKEVSRALALAKKNFKARDRARLLRALAKITEAEKRGLFMQEILELARGKGRYVFMARLLAPMLLKIEPVAERAWMAGDAARALYAAGHLDEAAKWFEIFAAGDTGGAAAVTRLWPLVRFAAGNDVDWDAARYQAWMRLKGDGGDGDEHTLASLVVSLLRGLGDPPPQTEAPGKPARLSGITLPTALPMSWRRLRAAGLSRRRGETVLLALVALGNDRLGEIEPERLGLVVTALNSVGLEAEARAFAVEAALAAGL